MQIVWNPQAKKNILSVKAYYQEFDSEVADKIVRGILSAVDRLEEFPESGRIVPEIGDPDFREVIWQDWRIIYFLPAHPGEMIEILNVIHTAQQFGSQSD
ncbi:MAG: type II toxin-antitoxin system RelE/ParE family toxin [Balneolaceae bacterium]